MRDISSCFSVGSLLITWAKTETCHLQLVKIKYQSLFLLRGKIVLPFNDGVLDHSSQPRRKKESHRSQYTHQYKHPEEYPVNDHGHILPVLLHLAEKRHRRERRIRNSHYLSFFTSR